MSSPTRSATSARERLGGNAFVMVGHERVTHGERVSAGPWSANRCLAAPAKLIADGSPATTISPSRALKVPSAEIAVFEQFADRHLAVVDAVEQRAHQAGLKDRVTLRGGCCTGHRAGAGGVLPLSVMVTSFSTSRSVPAATGPGFLPAPAPQQRRNDDDADDRDHRDAPGG